MTRQQGHDLQPDHTSKIPELMGKYGSYIRNKDYGGVHVFSGIPNRAFYLASVAFGGYSWEKAGQIWWKVLTGGTIPPNWYVLFALRSRSCTDCGDEQQVCSIC